MRQKIKYVSEAELESACKIDREYPLDYFIGKEFSNYGSIIEHKTFLDREFISEVLARGIDLFDESEAEIMTQYIRRNFGSYSVRNEYLAFYDLIPNYEKQLVSSKITGECVGVVENVESGKVNLTVILPTIEIKWDNGELLIENEDITVTVDAGQEVVLDLIVNQDGYFQLVNALNLVDYKMGEWAVVMDYSVRTTPDGMTINFEATDTPDSNYDFFTVNIGVKQIFNNTPNVNITLNYLRQVAVDVTTTHQHTWKALKEISDSYYAKIKDGSIIENYNVDDQLSGTDTETETRNFTDTNTPNLTTTYTPSIKTKDIDTNKRVSNVDSDVFHNQTQTIRESEIVEGNEVTQETGNDVTQRTGTGSLATQYGKKAVRKGILMQNQPKLYDKLWETTHREWIKKVCNELIFHIVYMSYGF